MMISSMAGVIDGGLEIQEQVELLKVRFSWYLFGGVPVAQRVIAQLEFYVAIVGRIVGALGNLAVSTRSGTFCQIGERKVPI